MKIHKLEKLAEDIYAIRVELDKYLDDPIIKFQPTPKMGDGWFADIFIEERKNEKS